MNLIEVVNGKFLFRFNAPSREAFDRILLRIKCVPGIKYNGPAKLWESPVSPSSAMDALIVAESFQFEITADCRRVIESTASSATKLLNLALGKTIITDNFGMKKALRPYQKAAVAYGITAGNHINGDSPGVGKTPVAIAIIDSQNLYPVLVVTIKRAKYHWYRSWQDWTGKSNVSVWTLEQRGNSNVDIIHYDMAPKLVEYIMSYRNYKSIILDESHKIKDKKTQRYQAIERIVTKIPLRIGLTGTVIVNSMKDLAVQLKIIDRIKLFGGEFKFLSEFTTARQKEIYIKGRRKIKVWEYTGVRNEEKLYSLLRANCFIGRKKREIMMDLPPISEEYVDIPADSDQYRIEYQNTVDALNYASEQLSGVREGSLQEKTILDDAEKNIFQLRRESGVAKLAGIKEWLFDWMECGEKIVVYAHHQQVQQEIASWFPGCAVLKAGQSEIEAQQQQDRFQQDPECKMIVCSMQAASEAITLTAASYMAICEPPWTDKDDEQMKGRIDRFGQQNPMTVYKLFDLSEKSVDTIMMQILEKKKDLAKINSTKYFIEKLKK